jgi:basic membrane protein A
MSSDNTKLYAGVVIALVLGAAVGWFAKPVPTDTVPKSTFDALQAQYNTVQSQLTQAQAQLADAQAQIAELSKPPKVGIVFATGGLGDKSFNDISRAGAQRAYEELGVEFDYVEPTAIAEYEGYQRDFAMSGDYILIVCIGFDQADALTVVASEYPDQNFALVDMVVDNANVASLTFRANEGSFLTGVVAGLTTTTGKVGFVGGMDIPLIRDFYVGYKAGAEWASPNVQVLEPVFVGDWSDPTRGKELAVGLWELGADCIFAAGGKSGLGALEACDEKNINGFGVDACQCYLNDNMVASMTKRVDEAVYEMILDALVDKFQGGFYSGGLSEGWVGMCQLPDEKALWEETFDFTHEPLTDAVINKVLEAKNKIISGEITVPSGYG